VRFQTVAYPVLGDNLGLEVLRQFSTDFVRDGDSLQEVRIYVSGFPKLFQQIPFMLPAISPLTIERIGLVLSGNISGNFSLSQLSRSAVCDLCQQYHMEDL
jgi:hypothetical protein